MYYNKKNEHIKEHYDLKFNGDKQAFLGINYLLIIGLFMIILLYFRINLIQCTPTIADTRNYTIYGSMFFIFLCILISIGFAFNNI
jgi:hypothetical protein